MNGRLPIAMLLAIMPLLGGLSRQGSRTFDDFLPQFLAFAKSQNPYFPTEKARELACVNWGLADGDWDLARRISAEQAHESGHFKLAAWNRDGLKPRDCWPRYDAGGSHLRLIAQEARKAGLFNGGGKWPYSDDFDHTLDVLARDPVLGTWLVFRPYVKTARKHGLNAASHWWQTGKAVDPGPQDPYLKDICAMERAFDRMSPCCQVLSGRVAGLKKSRRKR